MAKLALVLGWFGLIGLMSACAPAPKVAPNPDGPGLAGECQPAANCFFRNSPVRLSPAPVSLPGRSLQFFPTVDRLDFVDAKAATWIAPTRTLTDGASIPDLFIPIVGDPRSPEFVNAAALHDAYCGIGNEAGPRYQSRPWQEVHRMFYDGLVAGGTPVPKAQLMFSAVWLGGPRWSEANVPPEATKAAVPDTAIAELPDYIKKSAMRGTKFFIATHNPSMPRLMTYLDWAERRMFRQAGKPVPARLQ